MRVRKVSADDVKLYDLTKVKLKIAGNTQVVQFTAGNNKAVSKKTQEILDFYVIWQSEKIFFQRKSHGLFCRMGVN